MIFKKDFLEEKFREYYRETSKTATHIFVYSESQDESYYPTALSDRDKNHTYINKERYSEMRSRDYFDLSFRWEDTEFVAVGCDEDVIRLENI